MRALPASAERVQLGGGGGRSGAASQGVPPGAACEMKEFGCSAVVPRKDLATHMRESELQHLRAMAVLNFRLTRQLQQDAAEKDEKIAQLQMKMNKQKEELKKKMSEQTEELKKEMIEQKKELRKQMYEQSNEFAKLKESVQKLSATAHNIAVHTACHTSTFYTFIAYRERKKSGVNVFSRDEWSHKCGYKFKLCIRYFSSEHNDIGVGLSLETGEYDDRLSWPVKIKACLELLNQAGDQHHVERKKSWEWEKENRGDYEYIDESLMQYADLERRGNGVQYMMDDCLRFRLHLTVQAV